MPAWDRSFCISSVFDIDPQDKTRRSIILTPY